MPASFELASIIVSTYNRPDALEKVLLGLDEQTIDVFEVVVADDGSTEETARTIDRLRDRVGYRLKHAWQEDEGFRLARSRNVAVLQAEGDYLIFLDGDCIPLRDFVEGHRWLAEPGWFVKGSRVYMTEKFAARIMAEDVPVTSWPLWRWVVRQVPR